VLRNQPMLLDHFLVSTTMAEVAPSNTALVSGYCAAAHCRDVFPEPQAYKTLSDHCPIVLELSNGDHD
jgi:hypothetical protein